MDSQIDVEQLRARLKAMKRRAVLALCHKANVSASTVQKFRAGLIVEPGAAKVLALISAMNEKPAAKRVKQLAQQPAARDAFLKPEDDTPIDNTSK